MTHLAIVMMEAKTIHKILILWHIGLINTNVDDNGFNTKFNYCKHSKISGVPYLEGYLYIFLPF